jgi:TP901 family phage tail tape measure protein
VAERAAVTVKLANVAGESAETASEQLTAVWNNFYDGSKSLEYYADVMTALGAATASSTEEISQGLNKFAAVADTVGLSYEHAAAALATVTATTRQSADVVGTAFKTLFARVQGLSLGETLDDGTTLNKYSQALASVGINIKDASGDLKAMDNILDELGGKW